MDSLFKTSSSYPSLSLKDVIEARDLFHYHLINKKNVVATAVGLYRIRHDAKWPSETNHAPHLTEKHTGPRTLQNSEIRPYSWPCVYVFVEDWQTEEELAKHDASDMVPKTLYLPDGKCVPVCVIEAQKQPVSKDLKIERMKAARNILGPGSAIINEDGQGLTRIATAGAVVRDGERFYVLTNRHAAGLPGTQIKGMLMHRQPRIGVTAELGLTREDMHLVYPHFSSTNQFLLMDVGLVQLDDITQWKTDFGDIKPIKSVLDLYDNSFSLQLIGKKVVGNSAVSGKIRGEIHALFYRHKAMGGSEYISDFLIGPETEKDKKHTESFAVHHGDSATVMFIEHKENAKSAPAYYPFAMIWGRHEFMDDDNKMKCHPYALATSLSTTFNLLNLDFVTDINSDETEIWGFEGHYLIGRQITTAFDTVGASKDLMHFVTKNLKSLSVTGDITKDPKALEPNGDPKEAHFVPLADVPDNVWKSNVNFRTEKDDAGKNHRIPGPGSRGQNDNPNHFADMDLPYGKYKTFLEYVLSNGKGSLSPQIWYDYYESHADEYQEWADSVGRRNNPKSHRGALPFRVWQLFDVMIKADSAAQFLAAGGVLMHYVGDACQPLHTSYMSDGDPTKLSTRPRAGTPMVEASGVHSGYEDDMVDYALREKDLETLVTTAIGDQKKEEIIPIKLGSDAAFALIKLIEATHKEIEPEDIVDKWVELHGASRSDKKAEMWDTFGKKTVNCIARGTRYLAAIWKAAWDANPKNGTFTDEVAQSAIMGLYQDPKFAPSVPLLDYHEYITLSEVPQLPEEPKAAPQLDGALINRRFRP